MFGLSFWALVADAYIPALLLACLAIIADAARLGEWRRVVLRLTSVLSGAGIAFGVGWLDSRYGFWPRLGMDYSTHTAVALVLGLFLLLNLRRGRWLGLGSLPAYGLLMGYLGYHSVADMLSTAVVVAVLYGAWLRYVIPRFR